MERILHIVHSMNMGGLEAFIMNVYRTIDKSKYQFDFVVFTKKEGYYNKEIRSLGGRLFSLSPRNQGFLQYKKALDSFFKERATEFSAIHQHASSLTSISPLIYAKKYGIRVRIIHSHSSALKGGKLHLCLHKINRYRVRRYATHFFACSDVAAAWFYLPQTPVEIIKNGIDTSKFGYDVVKRKLLRDECNLEDRDVVFGHLGNFLKVKNHKFIIEIFKAFTTMYPNSQLWLIGDGELRSEMEAYTKVQGIEKKVQFFGRRSDAHILLQAIDIFIFPSFFEGLPLALVEAQAAGLKLFVSDQVSRDAKLTSHIYFKSIKESSSVWAKGILDVLPYEREDCSEMVKSVGFDIRNTASELLSIYTN